MEIQELRDSLDEERDERQAEYVNHRAPSTAARQESEWWQRRAQQLERSNQQLQQALIQSQRKAADSRIQGLRPKRVEEELSETHTTNKKLRCVCRKVKSRASL